MTDKTAREAAKSAQESAKYACMRVFEVQRAAQAELAALHHKFDLLMEFLNAREVEYPEVPAIPAYKKIEKVRK